MPLTKPLSPGQATGVPRSLPNGSSLRRVGCSVTALMVIWPVPWWSSPSQSRPPVVVRTAVLP